MCWEQSFKPLLNISPIYPVLFCCLSGKSILAGRKQNPRVWFSRTALRSCIVCFSFFSQQTCLTVFIWIMRILVSAGHCISGNRRRFLFCSRHAMEALATIAGMNLSRHANAKYNAGSIIGGHASDVISDKKGYRISGKPWDVCRFIGYQRNNTPSFLGAIWKQRKWRIFPKGEGDSRQKHVGILPDFKCF